MDFPEFSSPVGTPCYIDFHKCSADETQKSSLWLNVQTLSPAAIANAPRRRIWLKLKSSISIESFAAAGGKGINENYIHKYRCIVTSYSGPDFTQFERHVIWVTGWEQWEKDNLLILGPRTTPPSSQNWFLLKFSVVKCSFTWNGKELRRHNLSFSNWLST